MKKTKRFMAAVMAAAIMTLAVPTVTYAEGTAGLAAGNETVSAEKLDWSTLKNKSDSEIMELYKAYCQEAGMNFSLYTEDEDGNKVFTTAFYRWQARAAYDTAPETTTYFIDLDNSFDVDSFFDTTGKESYETSDFDVSLLGFSGNNNISCYLDINIGGTILLRINDPDCKKTSIYEEMRRIMAIYYSDFITSYKGDDPVISEDYPVWNSNYIKGDANVDAKLNVADAVSVLQYIANSSKYPLGDIGKDLADIDGEEGITGGDAIAIQKIDAAIWDE